MRSLPSTALLAAALCASDVSAEMYDDVISRRVPNYAAPVKCVNGCARWSNLAADGNTRDQAAVDAKWRAGKAPSDAENHCAMPSNDPDLT